MVFLFYDMHSVPWLQKRIHEPINLQINWDGTTQRRLIRLAFPLGLTAMLASLNTNIPRYLLENYFGEGTLGLFTAMAYLLVAGNAVVGALGQSASPRLAKYFASNRKAFQQLLIKLLAIALVLGIAGILLAFFAGSELLTLLYSLEYAQNLDVFLWLCLAATVSYMASFLGYGMTAARSFRVQPFIFLFVSIVTLLSGLYLIPRYGLLGASWVLLIAAVTQAGSALAVNIYALKKASSENFALGG